MIIGSIISLLIPILSQKIIDFGVFEKDLNLVKVLILAQLSLFLGKFLSQTIRERLVLFISYNINISIISLFLQKLMSLQIAKFELSNTGDFIQKINDNKRIENFLTSTSIQFIFSAFNIIALCIILGLYSIEILGIFFIGTILYFVWVLKFTKKRKEIDDLKFSAYVENNSYEVQMIQGMQDIKLYNRESFFRNRWKEKQLSIFRLDWRNMNIEQLQSSGGTIINEVKNLLITYIAAYSVISDDLSIGILIAIQQIVGQLNSPMNLFISFFRQGQDAFLSMSRLNQVYNENGESTRRDYLFNNNKYQDINLVNVKFGYNSENLIFNDLNLNIANKRITAIVGSSGCGKSTLLKLILKFYNPIEGEIKYGETSINEISETNWRNEFGTVLQNVFIFNDTVLRNITMGENNYDKCRLEKVIRISNINNFVQKLSSGFETVINDFGSNLSQGQKQRILIARALFKKSNYLLFDEATSFLDSVNEYDIFSKIFSEYPDKTIILVSHRLSTIKMADYIYVLKDGEVIEQGKHEDLKINGIEYNNLFSSQLVLQRF
jgi:ATP-binding cassette subfamily B protein